MDKNLISSIVKAITEYKDPEKIVVFGSRATGNYKRTSDIDIAIWGKGWSDKDVNIVKHNLDEVVKTPLKIDVLNIYAVKKDKLKQNISKEGKIIYESGKD